MIHRGTQTHLLWVWNNIQYKQEGTDRDLLLFDSSLKTMAPKPASPAVLLLRCTLREKPPNKR